MTRRLFALIALSLFGPGTCAYAQDYPTRPIRIISPFVPGGFNDALSRIVAQRFLQAWGQQGVVDNRPGANMIVGSGLVAKAAPDGYTMFMGAVPHAINPSLYKLPYDPIKDFTPVALICSVPNLLVVHPSIPANSVGELIAHAKANPGKLAFGSTGAGSSSHMAGEFLKLMAKVEMVHVPYKGGALVFVDLLAGRLHLYIGATTAALPHVRAGKLRALGVTTLKRVPSLPDMPTVAESGLPGFDVASWYGLIGPAGVRPDVVAKINAEIQRMVEDPEVRERLKKDGAEPSPATPDEFAQLVTQRHSEVDEGGQDHRDQGELSTERG
jgi:tripartite-type tricarboxylate transporter receptor subunit TctC